MIKYLGSKRRLVPRIVALAEAAVAEAGPAGAMRPAAAAPALPPAARDPRPTALDLFSGTTRVAQGLKRAGFAVTANDLAAYGEVLARCYVAADARAVDVPHLEAALARLDGLPGVRGYVTRTFCEEARYFRPENGMRIDAVRGAIDAEARDATERAILLTALLEAADRVDSTTGLQMAFLKQWAPRSARPLALRFPALIDGTGTALGLDARECLARPGRYDVAYLDPPYNQHSYFSNYHAWETIVRWDAPPAYGVARKREDCRTVKSDFNVRGAAWEALRATVLGVPARHVIVSFSDEGFFTVEALRGLLGERGDEVAELAVDSPRYVGARIGIHNPQGERVGEVSHVRNTEHLFVAGPGARAVVARAEAALAAMMAGASIASAGARRRRTAAAGTR